MLLHSPLSLADIFCYETPRVLSNDYVVSYHRRLFQITRHTKPLPRLKAQVIVRELLDGRVKLLYQNTELAYVELSTPPQKEALAPFSALAEGDFLREVRQGTI